MGILIAFAVGYTLGARAGQPGFEEVVASVKAIRASEEFDGLVKSLRVHASYVLKEIAELLDSDTEPVTMTDIMARARALTGQFTPTTRAS